MLGIHIHIDPAKASSYHAEHLASKASRQGYYSEDNQNLGQWFGRGAAMLGMIGSISKDQFDNLCRNRHPTTKESVTVRRNSKARVMDRTSQSWNDGQQPRCSMRRSRPAINASVSGEIAVSRVRSGQGMFDRFRGGAGRGREPV